MFSTSKNMMLLIFFFIYYSDDSLGVTPLCVAAYHGHEAIVEFLVQPGAYIDGKFHKPEDEEVNWRVCY